MLQRGQEVQFSMGKVSHFIFILFYSRRLLHFVIALSLNVMPVGLASASNIVEHAAHSPEVSRRFELGGRMTIPQTAPCPHHTSPTPSSPNLCHRTTTAPPPLPPITTCPPGLPGCRAAAASAWSGPCCHHRQGSWIA